MKPSKLNRLVVKYAIYGASAFLLSACATEPARTSGASQVDIREVMRGGQVRLSCGLTCSGSWGAARRRLKSLYDNQLWEDLATEVLRIGFEGDLSYYYLARASEGLGYVESAATYYRLSMTAAYKCDGLLNNCDGFIFPGATLPRLDALSRGALKSASTAIGAPPVTSDVPPVRQTDAVKLPEISPRRSQELMIGGQIESKYDEFKKLTTFTGPAIGSGSGNVLLRAWKFDSGIIKYQMYVVDYYEGNWRFYSSGWDSDGKSLNITTISRDVGSCSRYSGCSHYEHIGVNFNREYLEMHSDKGIRLKLSGNGGEGVFSISGPYVAAFLESMK